MVSGLNVRLPVTLEDGHLPTVGGTQGLGSLIEPTCVFVGMLGGASSLVTATKRAVTTVGGATAQAGAGKVSYSSSFYAAEANIWRWFLSPVFSCRHQQCSHLVQALVH